MMIDIDFEKIKAVLLVLAQKHGFTVDDLDNETLPFYIDEEGDKVFEWNDPNRWSIDYHANLNSDFEDDIKDLKKSLDSYLEAEKLNDHLKMRTALSYIRIYARNLESLFSGIADDTERLCVLERGENK